MRLRLTVAALLLFSASCGTIDPVPGTEGVEPAWADRTVPFGFRISVPADLAEAGWQAKDPQFLVGNVVEGFQQLQLRRVFGLQVDAPPGGEHLLNNNNEFGSNPRATRLVVYVYEQPSDVTFEAVVDSVRGVAYAALDRSVNGLPAKSIVYQGTREPPRPRNASDALIPRYILRGGRYLYFLLTWETEPDMMANVLRVLSTFELVDP